jgi:hypothetical protein
LMPYLHIPEIHSSSHPGKHNSIIPNPPTILSLMQPSLSRCSTAFVSHIADADLTNQEQLIKYSIVDVQTRICQVIGAIHAGSLSLSRTFPMPSSPVSSSPPPPSDEDLSRFMSQTNEQILKLMQWLGWTEWIRCKNPCKPLELCMVDLWPVNAFLDVSLGIKPRHKRPRDEEQAWCRAFEGKKSSFTF